MGGRRDRGKWGRGESTSKLVLDSPMSLKYRHLKLFFSKAKKQINGFNLVSIGESRAPPEQVVSQLLLLVRPSVRLTLTPPPPPLRPKAERAIENGPQHTGRGGEAFTLMETRQY